MIWFLYQNDALCTVDETFIAAVGYRLLRRCRYVRLVTRREVECPRCRAVFALNGPGTWKLLPGVQTCFTTCCGWETISAERHASWRHHNLLCIVAMAAVETYLRDYPLAKEPEERMVCIDQLIHAFHVCLKDGKASRSFSNNLIEGSHEQVVALLDRLFEKSGRVNKDQWREEIESMFHRRKRKE